MVTLYFEVIFTSVRPYHISITSIEYPVDGSNSDIRGVSYLTHGNILPKNRSEIEQHTTTKRKSKSKKKIVHRPRHHKTTYILCNIRIYRIPIIHAIILYCIRHDDTIALQTEFIKIPSSVITKY